MTLDAFRGPLLLAGAGTGYLVMMATSPVRTDLNDGLRCLQRQKRVWLLPLACAVAHAGFKLWVHFYESFVIPNAPSAIKPWAGWQPPAWGNVLAESLLPAAEGTSAIFNCIVITFPLSALWALVFLCNWRGCQRVVFQAVHRRCGVLGGLAIHGGVLVCALAAVCKPLFFGGLPTLNGYFGEDALLRLGETINAVSFLFEYLLGVGVQVYVVLLTLMWVRGLSFDFDHLLRFALRRLTFASRWAAVVLVVSVCGINGPLLLAAFHSTLVSWMPVDDAIVTRWLLVVVLLICCPVQALLIFHNESLHQALKDAARFWRHYGWHIAWMLATVAVHFLLLAVANVFLPQALGAWTWPTTVWGLVIYPLIWSALAGWFLASWICLFRRCESGSTLDGELVRF